MSTDSELWNIYTVLIDDGDKHSKTDDENNADADPADNADDSDVAGLDINRSDMLAVFNEYRSTNLIY